MSVLQSYLPCLSKQFPTDLEITKSDGYLGGEPQESACLYLLSAEITGIPQVSLFAVAFYPPAHGEISAPLTCDLLPADCQLQPYTTGLGDHGSDPESSFRDTLPRSSTSSFAFTPLLFANLRTSFPLP